MCERCGLWNAIKERGEIEVKYGNSTTIVDTSKIKGCPNCLKPFKKSKK